MAIGEIISQLRLEISEYIWVIGWNQFNRLSNSNQLCHTVRVEWISKWRNRIYILYDGILLLIMISSGQMTFTIWKCFPYPYCCSKCHIIYKTACEIGVHEKLCWEDCSWNKVVSAIVGVSRCVLEVDFWNYFWGFWSTMFEVLLLKCYVWSGMFEAVFWSSMFEAVFWSGMFEALFLKRYFEALFVKPYFWSDIFEAVFLKQYFWSAICEALVLKGYFWSGIFEALFLTPYFWSGIFEAVFLKRYLWSPSFEGLLLKRHFWSGISEALFLKWHFWSGIFEALFLTPYFWSSIFEAVFLKR